MAGLLEAYSGFALTIGVMLASIVFGGAILGGGAWAFMRWKRYKEYECIIFAKEGMNQWYQKKDVAGVFVDNKTKNKMFFMRGANVGLNADHIPFVTGSRGNKTVYLIQVGLKNFRFIKMNPTTDTFSIKVGEEDVNWALNTYEKQKKDFGQTLLAQLLPYFGIAFVTVGVIIIFVYLFKEMGVMKDVALAFRDAAQIMAESRAGEVL